VRSIRKKKKWLIPLILFVMPYALVYMPGVPGWVGRAVGVVLFHVVMNSLVLAWCLNPRSRIIAEGAKLTRPGYERSRQVVERVIRVSGVIFGIVFCYFLTIPVLRDSLTLTRGASPQRVEGRVTSNSMVFGLWFLKQGIRLNGDGSYTVLYSLQPIKVGGEYELLVLPRSRLVVGFSRLD